MKNPLKYLASGIGSATSWSVKKTLGIKPMFNLKYYQSEWDQTGVKLYDTWTSVGSNLGIRDPEAPPVLLHPDTPPPEPEQAPRVSRAAERMIDAAKQTVQAGVDLGQATVNVGTKSTVALTDLAKAAGIKTTILVVGTAASGWNKFKSLKDKILTKKEQPVQEPTSEEPKLVYDEETNTWIPEVPKQDSPQQDLPEDTSNGD